MSLTLYHVMLLFTKNITIIKIFWSSTSYSVFGLYEVLSLTLISSIRVVKPELMGHNISEIMFLLLGLYYLYPYCEFCRELWQKINLECEIY